jgi:pimeloyl-ACP methyl ester carboxylesterase
LITGGPEQAGCGNSAKELGPGMQGHDLKAPLAMLHGASPPAPAWFQEALTVAPARSLHRVEGAQIEALTWGERGRPGILFLHGNAAHAEWWSFIAPLFAREHRVTAISWSGMGGSAWREAYSLDLFVAEAFAAAEATGLFAAAVPPVFVGHSFGGLPTAACAARRGEKLRAAIIVDSPFWPAERAKEQHERIRKRRGHGPSPVYRSVAAALARFRLLPAQPCDNLFIVDYIARRSLKEIGAGAGWTWRFDPYLWRRYQMSNPTEDLAAATCPVAIIRGSRSKVMTEETAAFAHSIAPVGSPMIEIPEAHHHVMIDQPLAFVTALRALLSAWPVRADARSTACGGDDGRHRMSTPQITVRCG